MSLRAIASCAIFCLPKKNKKIYKIFWLLRKKGGRGLKVSSQRLVGTKLFVDAPWIITVIISYLSCVNFFLFWGDWLKMVRREERGREGMPSFLGGVGGGLRQTWKYNIYTKFNEIHNGARSRKSAVVRMFVIEGGSHLSAGIQFGPANHKIAWKSS